MRDLILITLGVLLSMTLGFAFPKTADEAKWEKLEERRAVRRATEAKHEACVRHCMGECK